MDCFVFGSGIGLLDFESVIVDEIEQNVEEGRGLEEPTGVQKIYCDAMLVVESI